jgi:predicted S18 family serine protease
MHTAAIEARLKSNRLAYAHFQKFQSVYKGYAQSALEFYSKYPKMDLESRAKTVKDMIVQMDPNIWGLATFSMTAEEIADSFARMVVGHEAS